MHRQAQAEKCVESLESVIIIQFNDVCGIQILQAGVVFATKSFVKEMTTTVWISLASLEKERRYNRQSGYFEDINSWPIISALRAQIFVL